MANPETISRCAAIIRHSHSSAVDAAYLEACNMIWEKVPDGVLEMAVKRVLSTWESNYAPSPSVILSEARLIHQNRHRLAQNRPWADDPYEGWTTEEIQADQMEARRIISEYVTSLGSNASPTLVSLLDRMPSVEEDLTRIYEQRAAHERAKDFLNDVPY